MTAAEKAARSCERRAAVYDESAVRAFMGSVHKDETSSERRAYSFGAAQRWLPLDRREQARLQQQQQSLDDLARAQCAATNSI